MRRHFSRVKDSVLVAVQRRDAGRAEHGMYIERKKTESILGENIKDEKNSVRQLIEEIEKFDSYIDKSGYLMGKESIDQIEAIIFSYQGTPKEDECDL